VRLERDQISLVRIIEELLERKHRGFSLEDPRLVALEILSPDDATPFYSQKLALNSPTSGYQSFGVVRFRTKTHGVFVNCNKFQTLLEIVSYDEYCVLGISQPISLKKVLGFGGTW
jgi:hypothetical protein